MTENSTESSENKKVDNESIPQLRFPEFKKQIKKSKIKEILNYSSSNLSLNKLVENTGNYPLYGAEGLVKNIDFYEMDEEYISIIKDGAGVGRLKYNKKKSSIVGTMGYLTLKEPNNLKYIYYALSLINLEKYIIGSTIPHIYFKDYSKETINLPSINEQNKIESLLSSIDRTIELMENKYNYLLEYKKSLIYKMFTNENHNNIRFIEFNEERKKIKLHTLLKYSSSSLSLNKLEDNLGKYPLFGADGFVKNIDFFEKDEDYISIVKDGAGVGRLKYNKKKSSIVGTMGYLTLKEPNNLKYIYYAMSLKNLNKYIIGSTIPHIYFKDYSKETIKIPSLQEQNKIVNLISSYDNLIENIRKKIIINKEFKKELLKKMVINY